MGRNVAVGLLRGASLYAVAFVAPRIVRLVLVPIVVLRVGLETYGKYVILTLLVPFAHVLAELGTGTAALRLAPEESDRGRLFSSMLASRVACGLVVAAAMILFRAPIAATLTGSAHGDVVVWVAAMALASALLGGFGDQLRSEERHGTLASLNVARHATEASFTFVLVVALRGGLRELVVARLLSDVTMLMVFAWTCRATFAARPHGPTMRVLLRLGAPIAALYLLVSFREIDRYLIKAVLGVAEVGRYDLALRIVGPVALANLALTMVLEPHVYRTYGDPAAGANIALFVRAYVAIFATVAYAVSMLAPELFPLLAPNAHRGAAVVAPSLLFSFVAEGLLRAAGLGAELAKKTIVWGVAAVAHLAVALPLTWWLLRPLGILGAACALLAGTLVASAVAASLSRRLFPIDVPIVRSAIVVVGGALSATAVVAGVPSIALRAASIVPFALLAFVVAAPDLRAIRRWIA